MAVQLGIGFFGLAFKCLVNLFLSIHFSAAQRFSQQDIIYYQLGTEYLNAHKLLLARLQKAH